jgi:hypothetical protein
MTQQNHWEYRIYCDSYTGKPEFVAAYITATDLKSIEADLAEEHSYLERYLRQFFGIEPREYAEKHQLRAQALLGGLAANHHCSLHSALWLSVAPPPARALRVTEDLSEPTAVEHGVVLWLREQGHPTRMI